ncbi:MAG: hypothetical protein Q4C96_07580 [Planctomycetia bacterium]|nr:hypothetical protein [Planctomycetia bacterium]
MNYNNQDLYFYDYGYIDLTINPWHSPGAFLKLAQRFGISVVGIFLFGYSIFIHLCVFKNTDFTQITWILSILLSVCMITSGYFLCSLIYRCWSVVQDNHGGTTPAQAVKLLFIPIFHFYWVFIAVYELAEKMNAFCDFHHLGNPAYDRIHLGVIKNAIIMGMISCFLGVFCCGVHFFVPFSSGFSIFLFILCGISFFIWGILILKSGNLLAKTAAIIQFYRFQKEINTHEVSDENEKAKKKYRDYQNPFSSNYGYEKNVYEHLPTHFRYRPEGFHKLARWYIMSLLGIFFLICILVSSVFWSMSGLTEENPAPVLEEFTLIFICFLGGISTLLLMNVTSFCILIYRCWSVIQDEYVRTTPGRAVKFLFIPVFNLYWIFVAILGLAQDMNVFCNRYDIWDPYRNRIHLFSVFLSIIFVILGFFFIPFAIPFIWTVRNFARAGAMIQKRRFQEGELFPQWTGKL